jgi:cytochrome c oxidase subunit II
MKLKPWIAPLVLSIAATVASVGNASAPRRIEIALRRFSYSPNQITLKKGEPAVLVLTSRDVTHGLAIKELGIRTDVAKGQTTEVAVTPMQAGTFQGKCSHFCGKGHIGMTLTIHVEN